MSKIVPTHQALTILHFAKHSKLQMIRQNVLLNITGSGLEVIVCRLLEILVRTILNIVFGN